MSKPLEFLAGLLVGVAVGSTTTVLLTPRSGRHVRASVLREAKRIAVRATGLHPSEWSEITADENGRNLVANLEKIRSAGL